MAGHTTSGWTHPEEVNRALLDFIADWPPRMWRHRGAGAFDASSRAIDSGTLRRARHCPSGRHLSTRVRGAGQVEQQEREER